MAVGKCATCSQRLPSSEIATSASDASTRVAASLVGAAEPSVLARALARTMCLPGLCPGDNFDKMGLALDNQIAALAEKLKLTPAPMSTTKALPTQPCDECDG